MSDKAIDIQKISKVYKLYDTPRDRMLEALRIGRRVRHREFSALRDVSFDVQKGEVVGIIGTNGAGKSTLLKIITGVLSPTSGTSTVNGKVSALLELGAGFNQECTGLENIYMNGRMMGYTQKEMDMRKDAIISFADIGDFIYQPVKTYSSGMFARLAFAVSINVEPDILIVDEALSVGDLFFQNKCFRKFDELKQKGTTILFVSHDIGSVRQMCSRVLWLEKGTVKAFGEVQEICDQYMDEKRRGSEFVSAHLENIDASELRVTEVNQEREYPAIRYEEDRFGSDKVKIQSAYFTDRNGEKCKTLYVDREYDAHIVVSCMQDVESIIVGMVMENNKGLPLYDINNYINQGETIRGKAGKTYELVYHYCLPRIMNGVYVLGVAVADGTQMRHEMLSWLHGVMKVEVVNEGYNSSYIEIPCRISALVTDSTNVRYVD